MKLNWAVRHASSEYIDADDAKPVRKEDMLTSCFVGGDAGQRAERSKIELARDGARHRRADRENMGMDFGTPDRPSVRPRPVRILEGVEPPDFRTRPPPDVDQRKGGLTR